METDDEKKKNRYRGLKPFPKGVSGNPLGGKLHHQRAKAFRRATPECMARISEALFYGDVAGLRNLAQDPSMTPVEKLCVAVILRAVEKGDHSALVVLLDRFLGKVKDTVEVTASRKEPDLQELSDEELERRAAILTIAGKI